MAIEPLSHSEPSNSELPEFLPARTLCEYAFCPRAGYIEWVQCDNADNHLTLDGTYKHRRVHKKRDEFPPVDAPKDDSTPNIVRSLLLSSKRLELIGKIDLVELSGNSAVPVEYKRSKKPDNPEGAWEPVRVQLCAQCLLLRENGYACDYGFIYYIDSKERVRVDLNETLINRTLELSKQFRTIAKAEQIPPPLEDNPKCNGCSLATICLPDEIGMLKKGEPPIRNEPRRLIPARDDAMPVYVQVQGGYVGKRGDTLIVKEKGAKVAEAKLFETSQLVITGNAQVTTQALQELMRRGIPVIYMSTGGWFYGMAVGPMNRNVDLRIHQYEASQNPVTALRISRRFITGKIRNCRTLLRRNARGEVSRQLMELKESAGSADSAGSQSTLLGIEGYAAKTYFGHFTEMIKQTAMENGFAFESRNRRPPRDPVNALLSLSYSLLAKDLTVLCAAAGLDPFLGLYHKPRYGRPSLALDLMEEFRPLVADSTTLNAINNGVVSLKDFVIGRTGVNLKPAARRKFILTYERRMDQLIRHPLFGYQISYRRVLDVQVRLLGRFLVGELSEYPIFLTR
ncbi:MAG: CRISPR-associated endonuclease Cas1 [Deltaproteobacteria bacterium]|nr:CRISPR-associated endonuclease Cas1 [Deltaproteobacteria bacterium]